MFIIDGRLRDSGCNGRITLHATLQSIPGSLRMKRVWHQRAACENTKGLNRDYVSNERFDTIVERWVPADFSMFTIMQDVDDAEDVTLEVDTDTVFSDDDM